jgi:tRNA/rRNA methyltransferase
LVTFPVNPAFASLNIAQAVLLMSYEWMKSGLETETETVFRGPEMELAPKQELQGLFNHLEEALDVRGYFRPEARKEIMVNNLRAVLTRAGFASAELKLLRGVVTSLDVFTPKKPRGSGAPEGRARKPAPEDKAE